VHRLGFPFAGVVWDPRKGCCKMAGLFGLRPAPCTLPLLHHHVALGSFISLFMSLLRSCWLATASGLYVLWVQLVPPKWGLGCCSSWSCLGLFARQNAFPLQFCCWVASAVAHSILGYASGALRLYASSASHPPCSAWLQNGGFILRSAGRCYGERQACPLLGL
jgi:hypothetical protein